MYRKGKIKEYQRERKGERGRNGREGGGVGV
jgi:hypothetical protein